MSAPSRGTGHGLGAKLEGGARSELKWKLPSTGGQPIFEIGIEVSSSSRADGTVYLEYLTWTGAPNTTFICPEDGGTL